MKKNWIASFLICALLYPLIATSVLAARPFRPMAPVNDITLTLTSTTTQIVVSYTAPDLTACTLEVSESASYSPVVNDVNTTYFASSNSDSRTGALGAGTVTRQFIAGTIPKPNGLAPLIAGDASVRSRALKVNTTHYLRVTCSGGHTGTGSIATKNIPLGNTYGRNMPMVAAGVYGFPTMDATSRTEQIIDPVFGTVIRKVAINGDEAAGGGNAQLLGSGAPWLCAQSTTNDSSSTPGYLCEIPSENGTTRLYWANTANGDVRRLGTIHAYGGDITGLQAITPAVSFGAMFDPSDPTKIYFGVAAESNNESHFVRCKLPNSGNSYYDTEVAPDAYAPCGAAQWTDLNATTTLNDMMVTFTSGAYDKTKFQSIVPWMQDHYLMFMLRRGNQDSYGWLGVFDVNTSTVIAAFPSWQGGGSGILNLRWCGMHTPHAALGTSKMSWTPKSMYQSGVGLGPYFSTMTSNCDNSTDPCVFTVNGPPTSANADTTLLADATVGDEIAWTNGNPSERGVITAKSGNTWTVSRHKFGTSIRSHTVGVDDVGVYMQCQAHNPSDYTQTGPSWWNFLSDPHGTDTGGTNLIAQLANSATYSGHEGWANGYGLSETGYGAFIGAAAANNTVFAISDSSSFDGAAKSGAGDGWQKHPTSAQQTNASVGQGTSWGVDAFELENDFELSPTSLTNVTGTLFKFVNTNYTMDLKRLELLAFAGNHPLLDISSTLTGNQILGTSGDNYKLCIARAVNECRTGAAIGDVYVNAPSITTGSNCNSAAIFDSDVTELCIGSPPAFGQTLEQISMVVANGTGKYQRSLTQMLTPWKRWNSNADAHQTPDGKWIMFPTLDAAQHGQVWMVAAPPFPAYDSIDRNTFQQTPITVASFGGATEALIEFGYDANFNCRSRTEVCVSAQSNSPFFFASESFTAVSCASGCTINIPVLPDRPVYYRVKWRDSGHNVVATGSTFIVVDNGSGGSGSGVGGPTGNAGRLLVGPRPAAGARARVTRTVVITRTMP